MCHVGWNLLWNDYFVNRSSFMRKIVCRQQKKESLCNRGIAQSYLQVLHVHVFLVAPLSACDMAQAGADEHQGGVAIGEGTHDPGGQSQILCKLQMRHEQSRIIHCARQRIYPTAALCAV